MSNVWLIGYMGAGKSSVGMELATRLDRGFFDTDELIEHRTQLSIAELIRNHGWPVFREMERQLGEELSVLTNAIIATGGGMACHSFPINNMHQSGSTLFMQCPPAAAWRRVLACDSERPLLTNFEAFQKLYVARLATYEAAEHRVDCDRPIDEVVSDVLGILGHG